MPIAGHLHISAIHAIVGIIRAARLKGGLIVPIKFVEAVFTENITKLGDANQTSKTDLPLGSGSYRWIAFETLRY